MGRIIGLSGYAGSGKDAAARALIHRGFKRVSFADTLRDMAYAIDPLVDVGAGMPARRLQGVVDEVGWDVAKQRHPDVRRLLQRLGTDAGRNILGENIWVDAAFRRAGDVYMVITDVRFLNEAESVKERGGVVVRITRPGVGPVNQHPSETSLDDYDFDIHIHNDGSLQQLHDRVITELLDA